MVEKVEDFFDDLTMYGINYRLVNNGRPLLCNDNYYIAKIYSAIPTDKYLYAWREGIATVDRSYQRWEAWAKSDRDKLLHSVRDGLEINSIWLSWDGKNLNIFDAGNRTQTLNSFIYNEPIESPNGSKSHRLKVRESSMDEREQRLLFESFSEHSKNNFLKKMLDVNFYILIEKKVFEMVVSNPEKQYNLFETAANLHDPSLSSEKEEYDQYIMRQYKALQNGKQMNRMEIRKTDLNLRGYLLTEIETLALFNFPGHLYSFAPKRTDKVDYVAKIAHVAAQIFENEPGSFEYPLEWFGKSKEHQIDKLYESYNIENQISRNLVRFVKDVVGRMEKCRNIYKQNIYNGNASIINGDCYRRQDGWLFSAFFFGWVFQNYIIEDINEEKTKQNYIELSYFITDFFSSTAKWFLEKRNLRSDFFKVDRDSLKGMDQLGYDWISAIDFQNGKGDAITREWWNILVQVIELSNLKKRQQRVSFDEKTKMEILNRQDYRDQRGQPLSISDCEIHHITPLQYGGTNDIHNLVAVTKEEHKEIHKNL